MAPSRPAKRRSLQLRSSSELSRVARLKALYEQAGAQGNDDRRSTGIKGQKPDLWPPLSDRIEPFRLSTAVPPLFRKSPTNFGMDTGDFARPDSGTATSGEPPSTPDSFDERSGHSFMTNGDDYYSTGDSNCSLETVREKRTSFKPNRTGGDKRASSTAPAHNGDPTRFDKMMQTFGAMRERFASQERTDETANASSRRRYSSDTKLMAFPPSAISNTQQRKSCSDLEAPSRVHKARRSARWSLRARSRLSQLDYRNFNASNSTFAHMDSGLDEADHSSTDGRSSSPGFETMVVRNDRESSVLTGSEARQSTYSMLTASSFGEPDRSHSLRESSSAWTLNGMESVISEQMEHGAEPEAGPEATIAQEHRQEALPEISSPTESEATIRETSGHEGERTISGSTYSRSAFIPELQINDEVTHVEDEADDLPHPVSAENDQLHRPPSESAAQVSTIAPAHRPGSDSSLERPTTGGSLTYDSEIPIWARDYYQVSEPDQSSTQKETTNPAPSSQPVGDFKSPSIEASSKKESEDSTSEEDFSQYIDALYREDSSQYGQKEVSEDSLHCRAPFRHEELIESRIEEEDENEESIGQQHGTHSHPEERAAPTNSTSSDSATHVEDHTRTEELAHPGHVVQREQDPGSSNTAASNTSEYPPRDINAGPDPASHSPSRAEITIPQRASTRPQRQSTSPFVDFTRPHPATSIIAEDRDVRPWSPHLQRSADPTSYFRTQWWKPASIYSPSPTKQPFFNRRNAQIMAFSFGFIFPLVWFVGAFLPLPQKARGLAGDRRSNMVKLEDGANMDMDRWVAQQTRYENARWWRNLNRGMSVVGVAFIIIIVSFWPLPFFFIFFLFLLHTILSSDGRGDILMDYVLFLTDRPGSFGFIAHPHPEFSLRL